MPDPVTTAGAPPRKGKGKEIAGIPWWIWATGAGTAIVGYLYFRHVQNSAASNSASATPAAASGTPVSSPTGLSWSQFLLYIHDNQSSPAAHEKGEWLKVNGQKIYFNPGKQTIGYFEGKGKHKRWVKKPVNA